MKFKHKEKSLEEICRYVIKIHIMYVYLQTNSKNYAMNF